MVLVQTTKVPPGVDSQFLQQRIDLILCENSLMIVSECGYHGIAHLSIMRACFFVDLCFAKWLVVMWIGCGFFEPFISI